MLNVWKHNHNQDVADKIESIEKQLQENKKNCRKNDQNNYVTTPQLYGILYEAIYSYVLGVLEDQ